MCLKVLDLCFSMHLSYTLGSVTRKEVHHHLEKTTGPRVDDNRPVTSSQGLFPAID